MAHDMSSTPDDATRQAGEICIDASQLRPGVHVRLPVPWMDHHFMFSSFVIADEEQARLIAAMKLPQLFCDPARCKVPPLPMRAASADPTADGKAEQDEVAALEAAREEARDRRTRMMDALRERLVKAEQHYRGAARTVSRAIRGFSTNPRQSVADLAAVCEESTAALLADPDTAFVLIADKGHDDGHAAHALSVMTLSLLLGKQAQLPEQALRVLGTGALLHDIGKRLISPSILRNSERNRHEEAIFRTHCRSGHDEAMRAGSLSKPMLDAILHHHERIDGSGFPERLSGNAIPLAARIVAIADRFDSLVNPIDYRRALGPAEALSTIWTREQRGFDTGFLQLFVRAMGIYPPGSLVQLSDGRIGAVVGSAPVGKPLLPKVMIYAPEVPHREAIIADLATQEVVTIERVLRLQDRSVEEVRYLLPQRKVNWSCPAQ
jgi:HD-GYP domain-containing protein (c-di-GMP phosphodiesterase class II)